VADTDKDIQISLQTQTDPPPCLYPTAGSVYYIYIYTMTRTAAPAAVMLVLAVLSLQMNSECSATSFARVSTWEQAIEKLTEDMDGANLLELTYTQSYRDYHSFLSHKNKLEEMITPAQLLRGGALRESYSRKVKADYLTLYEKYIPHYLKKVRERVADL
jgi:hypothetical protein